MKIFLVEPYRSTLVLQAIHEGLMRAEPADGPSMQLIRRTASAETTVLALQMAVLADMLSMQFTDSRRAYESRAPFWGGPPLADSVTCTGLDSLGIVDLVDVPVEFRTRAKGLTDIRAIWRLERDFIDSYQDLILAQMACKGMEIDFTLFRLLRALRLGETAAVPVILSCVPHKHLPFARAILADKKEVQLRVDGNLFSTIGQLMIAVRETERSGAKLLGASLEQPFVVREGNNPPTQVWKIVVDALLDSDIVFPTPTSLKEVLRLRGTPEVVAFRQFLQPFLDAITLGDGAAASRLRHEVNSAAKHFRRLPSVAKLTRFVTYASLGIAVVEGLAGLFGPSLATGLVPVGLEALSKRWERETSWMYLAGDEPAGRR